VRELAGKVAVITGAASGIGLALARGCGAEGMKVVLADIDSEALDEAGAELARARVEGMAMTCDVAQAAEVEELANVAFGHFGAVHLLCNNAGVAGTVGPCWTIEPEEWDRDLAVNLGGVIHGIRAFVPRMLEQEGEAHILNTASVMGLLPAGMAASYGVSKAGRGGVIGGPVAGVAAAGGADRGDRPVSGRGGDRHRQVIENQG
jgi:NAD(P)-dependent dehydrogenase (short-subunit alcohol dehydrogenase family)